MTPGATALFLLCVAVATCAQSITGFALVLILLGLCGLFELAPLADVANVGTVLSLASAAVALRGSLRSLDWRALRATAAGTVVGVAAGVFLLGWLSANWVAVLRLLLGLTVVGCALVVLLRTEPLARRSAPRAFAAAGLVSGVLSGLFSAGGPPLVWHFYRQPMPLNAIRDSLVAALAACSLLRLGLVVPTGQFSPRALSMCAMAVPLSMALTWLLRRHPPTWPRAAVLRIVCALLLVTGAGLVVSALQALL